MGEGGGDGDDTSEVFVVVDPARARVEVKEPNTKIVSATGRLTIAGQSRDSRNGSEGMS